MAVHQCAPFCNNLSLVHELSGRQIVKYLVSMSTYVDLLEINRRLTTRGIVCKLHIEKDVDCYVDVKLYSGWDQSYSGNAENIISLMGYVINYAVCPLLWCSKLQKQNISH